MSECLCVRVRVWIFLQCDVCIFRKMKPSSLPQIREGLRRKDVKNDLKSLRKSCAHTHIRAHTKPTHTHPHPYTHLILKAFESSFPCASIGMILSRPL